MPNHPESKRQSDLKREINHAHLAQLVRRARLLQNSQEFGKRLPYHTQFILPEFGNDCAQNLARHNYNATPHDAIHMKPIDRFGIDLARVRFLAPSEHSDELFYAETVRKVKKDNTFSFQGRRYETPADLRDQEIQLRHDRRRDETTLSPAPVVIYSKGQRMGPARLLDTVANGLLRRKEQP